jgi:uncharacterized protein (TIGR04255 family)
MDYPHLQHAPIEEAIIGLCVEYDLGLLNSSLDALRSGFKEHLPQDTSFSINQTSFEISEESCKIGAKTSTGRVFKSDDEKQLLVLDGKSIRYHQLKPYSDWSTFTQEFFQLLDAFQNVFPLKEGATPFLRYINKFSGKALSDIDFAFKSDFLSLNEEKEAVFERSLYVTEIRSEHYRSLGRVLINAQKDESDKLGFILLDIDLKSNSSMVELKQATLNAHFNSLRQFKNDVFFSNVKNAQEVFR